MAIASPVAGPLTWERYLAEEPSNERYDIVDGVREATNPSRRHQRIQFRVAAILERFEAESGAGQMLLAPTDVLIRRRPLRTRQPDAGFISSERLALCPPETTPEPLPVAPELVVEILSPGERPGSRRTKIEDYRRVGVKECWVVDSQRGTVEVLALSAGGVEPAGTYGASEAVRSFAFPDLTAPVDEIFRR